MSELTWFFDIWKNHKREKKEDRSLEGADIWIRKRLCSEMDSEVFYHSADYSVSTEYVGLQWNNGAFVKDYIIMILQQHLTGWYR